MNRFGEGEGPEAGGWVGVVLPVGDTQCMDNWIRMKGQPCL